MHMDRLAKHWQIMTVRIGCAGGMATTEGDGPANNSGIPAEFSPGFVIVAADDQRVPFVLSSPHSGRIYPPEFVAASRLSPLALRKSEDAYVDQLFGHVATHGAPLIHAVFPRAYLDLNREPYELDPDLITDPLPDYANSRSVRVAGGLGTVARIVADGEEIYPRSLPLAAVLERISKLYFPFHSALDQLVMATRKRFGYAVLIDCHSMPSASMVLSSGPRPDIVIGDRFGSSSDARITAIVRDALLARGYMVEMNRPYAGGYITEHHGRPVRGISALQIEINRGLYLDERTLSPTAAFEGLARDLEAAFVNVFTNVQVMFEVQAAAE